MHRASTQTQRAETIGGRAQQAMTARNWAEAIALFESALQKLTEHPATLSPTVSAEVAEEQMSPEAAAVAATPIKQPSDGADDGSGQWYRVAMPALLRAGPSLSSRALERLEVGGVVQALQPEVECEGRRRLQVAGHVFGRGWCSLETGSAEPILWELHFGATSSRSAS